MNDTTIADRKAELARQADVIAAVERAHADELPHLGDDNGVPKDNHEPAPEAAPTRSVTTGATRTTEAASRNRGGASS